MKSLLDMSANVIRRVHCQNDSEILCIISHNKLEMALCYNLCMKVFTDLYCSLNFVWITLSLGLHISRRHVRVNVVVLASENGLFRHDACFEKNKQTYVKAGHVWTQ